MKRTHFPNKHPGLPYREKGEKALSFGVHQPPRPKPAEDDNAEKETLAEEAEELPLAVEEVAKPKDDEENETVTNKELMETILKMKTMMEIQVKEKEKIETSQSETGHKEKMTLVQGSKSVEELCMKGGLTAFESESKLICDVCHHDNLNDENARKQAVFSYDMFKHGDNFEDRSQPREFRNLKSHIVNHMNTNNHMKMVSDLAEKDKKDSENETYNFKVGMGRARQIYENVKNKCSFAKYESDCLVAALNGEEVGNINHSWKFAESVVNEISATIQTEMNEYFRTHLPYTGELPPVSLATDKMTQKRHTNHLAAFLTPDTTAPLTDSLLKPVFVGMPVVSKHAGMDIADQMIKIAEAYLVDLGQHLQALNNDGQYFGLNVEKHFYELRKDLVKRKEFLLFSWDPSQRNALADKDARKEQEDQKSYFNDVLETVQWSFRHIGYGKHFEEYLSICSELDINPRAPITFSDTRFPQFSYNTLRNFLQVNFLVCLKSILKPKIIGTLATFIYQIMFRVK